LAAFLPQSWQKHSAQVNLVDRLIHRRNRAGDRFDNELLAAIEAEKAETLESLARDIHSGSYQRRMYGETNQAVLNATMAALANCVLQSENDKEYPHEFVEDLLTRIRTLCLQDWIRGGPGP
jgi:hypothetical protein